MPKEDYHIVTTWDEFRVLTEELKRAKKIGFDLETSGFDWKHDQIVGWAFSTSDHNGWYVPVRHTKGEQLDPQIVADALRPILETADKVVIHNAKFDTRFTRQIGITLVGGVKADGTPAQVEDTLLAAFSAAEGFDHFGLKELEEKIFKVKPVSFNDLFPPRTKIKNIATVDYRQAGFYACADADYCLRIHNRYEMQLTRHFIYMLESRLWPVVQRIEELGVRVDPEALRRMASYVEDEAAKVEQLVLDQVELAVGRRIEFSIGSPKQLREVLYDVMGLPVKVKTPTGEAATSELALAALEDQYPVCRNILTFRSMLSNVRSMLSWIEKIDPEDGRIHTSYNQAGATSGRFASSDPNVQNIGKRKKWIVVRPDMSRYEISITPRDAFIADMGKYLLELDFSAIEFIIMAALAGETKIVEAYLRGDDVHKMTAADVYGIPVDRVTVGDGSQRELAKTVNYLTIYGGSADRLSKETQKPIEECEAFMRRFFEVRPKFAQFMQATRDRASRTKRVKTLFGRDQLVPEFFEPGRQAASKAMRACVNRVIQGTAADVHKMGLIRTVEGMRKLGYVEDQARLILQTHDSQTWEIQQAIDPDVIVPQLLALMGKQLSGLPRIAVDAKLGVTWGTLEKFSAKTRDEHGGWPQFFADMDKIRFEALQAMPEPKEVRTDGSVSFDEILSDPNLGIRIMFTPGEPLDLALAKKIKEVVSSFPGKNIVVIKASDGSEIEFKNDPTSLNVATLVSACRPILPNCTAAADRAAIIAAVVG